MTEQVKPAAQEIIDQWTSQTRTASARREENPAFATEVATTQADLKTVLEAVMSGFIPVATVTNLLSLKIVEGEKDKAEAQKLSLLDPLTGLYGRRGYEKRLDEELAEASRIQEPVSLAIIDLDNFSAVNNTYGHPIGDNFLQIFAEELRSRMRESDIACRLGGDEFVVIMQHTDMNGATTLFNKLINGSPATGNEPAIPPLMQAVTSRFNDRHNLPVATTMSVGISSTAIANYSRDNLYNSADRALYAAKGAGKNTYSTARPPVQRRKI